MPPVVQTLRQAIARQMSPQRLGSAVLGGLGAIALVLTALSVFVLGDAMATFRERELGIRSTLGATSAGLIRLLLGETIRPVVIGIAAGVGLSIAGARLVRAFVFQVEPLEPLRFAGVAGALLVIAVVVSLRPAQRAARVDVCVDAPRPLTASIAARRCGTHGMAGPRPRRAPHRAMMTTRS